MILEQIKYLIWYEYIYMIYFITVQFTYVNN